MNKPNIALKSRVVILISTLLIIFFNWIDINIYIMLLLAAPLTVLNLYKNFKHGYFGSFGLVLSLFLGLLTSLLVYISPSMRYQMEAAIFQGALIERHGLEVIKVSILSITSIILADWFILRKNTIGSPHGDFIMKKQAQVYSGILVIIISVSMLIDLAFTPTILTATYNEYETRLKLSPFSSYIHFLFPVFLMHLFVLADLRVSKRRVRHYLVFSSFISFFGLLTGSRSLFVFIFFMWFFYYYIWYKTKTTKTKYLKLVLLLLLAYTLVTGIAFIRGKSMAEVQFSEQPLSEMLSPLRFPNISVAPYQTAVAIELNRQGSSLEGQSYRDLIAMIIPSFLANRLGIERPIGGALTFTSYAPSVGGLNMVGEAYWNLGRYGPFIVFFIIGLIIAFLDKFAVRYGWTGRSVSVMLLFYTFVGIGYGTSVLWRAMHIAVLLLIFIHFFLARRKNISHNLNS